jgi:hypothetical protein
MVRIRWRSLFILILTLGGLFASISASSAEDCSNYPFGNGLNLESFENGVKIIATSAVSVSFDDIDSVKDARDEATLEAKSLIARFMSEDIRSDQIVARAVAETKSLRGRKNEATRNEVITRVKTLVSSANALLKGVVPLGECYTRGLEFRVSVGIKAGSIKSASKLRDSIQKRPANDSSSTAPAGTETTRGRRGYSDAERLKTF